ncbi:hypothetical protein GBA52_023493 [Prunus armeniaca]|nr:hypothetical protein GBA52_023493 [Prunus armeniaca]
MFLNNVTRRKLASLLRPWLREEPDLELKLGLLNSHAVAKNLRFDTSVLNQLFDESSQFSFKEVTVENLTVRFSNWFVPAFSIEFQGVTVTLSPGELMEERNVERRPKPRDKFAEDMKKKLSEIDPEGSALHGALEKLLATSPSTNNFRTTLCNLILKHCQLRMHDINVQVQVPILNDSLVCLLNLKDINADPQYLDHGCLLRGLFGALFLPLKEISFTLVGSGFEVGFKRADQLKHVLLLSDLCTCIKLNDLQLVDISLGIPELRFSFSPDDIFFYSAFGKASSQESHCSRNAVQLWKLAASRIDNVTSGPRRSLQKLVVVVCLWLRYVNAYEHLLLLIGYSDDHSLKRSATRISQDKMFFSSVKNQMKVISDIEKELPAEAIAQAWRIARHRAASNVQCAKDGKDWPKEPKKVNLKIVSGGPWTEFCFILILGNVLITISHINEIQLAVNEKLESHIGTSCSDFLSFRLSVDSLLLKYVENTCEQSVLISCGQLKVRSSSLLEATVKESSSKSYFSSMEAHWKESNDDLKNILWAEPAQNFPLSETYKTGYADHVEGACLSLLKNFLGDMWLNWNTACKEFEKSEIQYFENPFLLCEIKNFLTYPDLKNSDSGFLKFFLTLGKLNIVLGCSSILSISLLFKQIQHALFWTEDNGQSGVLSHSRRASEDNKYRCYASKLEMTLLKILPEKHIQLGIFAAGPHIHISLGKNFDAGNKDINHEVGQEEFHLAFDFCNIEAAVWPTSQFDMESFVAPSGPDDIEPECLRLEQPLIVDMFKSDSGKYQCQEWISLGSYLRVGGLEAYLVDSAGKRQSQILGLKPITVRLLSFREYVHSFSTSVIAFSAALCGTAEGFTILSYADEFYVFFQVLENLSSAISYSFSSFGSISYLPFKFAKQEFAISEPENAETTAHGAPLNYSNSLFSINGTFKIKSVAIILHKSRISGNVDSSVGNSDVSSSKKLAEHDLPDTGISISIHQTTADLSWKEGKVKVLSNLSEIQSVIFRYKNQKGKSTDHSDLLLQSFDCLYELSLSSSVFNFSLSLSQNYLSSDNVSNAPGTSTSVGKTVHVENLPFTTNSESSNGQDCRFLQDIEFASNVPPPGSGHWLLINVVLGNIYMGRYSAKNVMNGAHQLNTFLSSLSVGGEFQTICCGIQGGFLFLEITALATFVNCFASYLHCFTNLLSGLQSSDEHIEEAEISVDTTRPNDHSVQEYMQETHCTSQQAQITQMEAFILNISHFSCVLMIEDEHGGMQELVLEVDLHLNFQVTNMRRKLVFDLSRMSILSQAFQEIVENEIQIPHFSSVTSNAFSSDVVSGGSAEFSHHGDRIHPVNDASCSRDPGPQEEFSVHNSLPEAFRPIHQNYILKHAGAVISVEKPLNDSLCLNEVWVGSGSISCFDITISLSEIQMLLSMISSFSGVFKEEMISEPDRRHQSSNEEFKNSLETMIPNGAIVAIQDVHQHMYFTVEGEENKFNLVGVVHYSLVGERALFRVKYHNQGRWKSSVSWFSLISLYAKNDLGEPLRLNYRPGSGFVDLSSANDNGWALWKAISCEPENSEGDIDWEPNIQLVQRTFYLLNKKSDSAVAFVDGIPEFVRKPGNPFKLKVFHNASVARDIKMDSYPGEASGTSLQHDALRDDGNTSVRSGKLPCIDVTFDKISLTIFHELVHTEDMFPLLCGCIDQTKLTVQILPSKTRVISMSTAVLHYFDAQKNLWRELLHPVEVCLFYRSSFQLQGSQAVSHGVPVRIHCRTKELNISLSELSLDILLFVIGKLNLAGPYSVRSNKIWANCCKVVNQSGSDLLCHFFDKQSVTVSRMQSASVILRCSDLANQPPEIASVVSIQLAVPRSFVTKSIDVSLIEAQVVAWKTQITSLQDSKTFPGPFVVVDVSRKSEDGLSIVISPLIRIHNETGFPMELRFRRAQQKEDEFASVMLNAGDTIDDSMAMFDALNLSGGRKKALMSLGLGNFLLSFRPEIPDGLMTSKNSLSVEWSDDLKGGKAVRLSGIFDRLSYRVRNALFTESVKCSFSTAQCTLKSEGARVSDMHFLVQSIGRNVPVVQPNRSTDVLENNKSPVAFQEQKDIYLLPTVRVSNLLHTEVHVFLSESDRCYTVGSDNDRNQSTISCGSMVEFYANPSIIYFTVTLTAYNSSCRPVNSSDWIKKLQKQKSDVPCLDIDLDFGGGKYFASLRLSRGNRGTLEAAIFTSYSLRNDTEFTLYFYVPNKRPLSRDEAENYGSGIPPEFGSYLPPKTTRSWFLKPNKVCLKLLEDNASETLIDLDALSGLAEISLEVEEGSGVKYITKLGVSTGPPLSRVVIPSQVVTMVPRHVVVNESEQLIIVRQCYLQDDSVGMIPINSKQRATLQLQDGMNKKRDFSLFEHIMKKHRKVNDDSLIYLQFQLNESKLSWSGPVCIASLGRFFLKFKKPHMDQVTALESSVTEFAAVHVVEEGSTLVLRFHKPPNVSLPYRIENCLHDVSITYYQKDSLEPEILGSESGTDYVWDDLTLPHKLVVRINDSLLLREINLDKVRAWKPFYKLRQQSGLASHLPLGKRSVDQRIDFGELNAMEMVKVGYEVYADGPTRVLRFCEISRSHKGDKMFHSCEKIQLRVPQFTVHLLEHEKKASKRDGDDMEPSAYKPILAARIGNINFDSLFTHEQKFSQICVQSVNLEHKWVGAPFAAMLRRHESDYNDSNDCVLKIVVVFLSTSSNVVQVKYSSIALQPMDLNLDEETLMKIVPFWRTSLSNSKSQQYYFDHFEIHPIKIFANFLPGDSYSSYSSAEETLRSLLHSVVKVPAIKNKVVELNGVMVTHALITMRELLIKCAQHYSWYAMRAIYIAKGSPLLPPDFVSIFDDLASSSLDVFFDPSRGLKNLPGLTLGTFKLISKCIDGNGFSGTKRYFGDLGKSLRTAGSNVLFAAITEISDSVLKVQKQVVTGFHQGILKLAMEPSLLGTALMEGGPDRKIKLDRSPVADELYIEGYLQAMLDTVFRQEYLRVRVIDNQVYLKNLPPNSSLIEEIMDRVKGFLVSKALLKGDPSITSRPLSHLRGESEWRLGPTVLTLCEHLFVSFAIRLLRKQANKFIAGIKWNSEGDNAKAVVPANPAEVAPRVKFAWKWGIGKFLLSGIVAYIDGRLCRCIPNPVARRIVSGFLLTFLDNKNNE